MSDYESLSRAGKAERVGRFEAAQAPLTSALGRRFTAAEGLILAREVRGGASVAQAVAAVMNRVEKISSGESVDDGRVRASCQVHQGPAANVGATGPGCSRDQGLNRQFGGSEPLFEVQDALSSDWFCNISRERVGGVGDRAADTHVRAREDVQ